MAGTSEDGGPLGESGPDGEHDEVSYTIDELSGLSGVPSRTIRFYQSNGTLPPPERRGRVAYYDDTHLERLRTIAALQERGLRLDAIRDVLAEVQDGRDSLQSWLGFGDELQAPWLDEQPIVIGQAELDAKLAGMPPRSIPRLEEIGMLVRQGNTRPATYLVPSPVLFDIAIRLQLAGVDLEVSSGAEQLIRKRLGRSADELVPFFAEVAGRGFGQGGLDEVTASYRTIRDIGMLAVQVIFAQEMERALRGWVERGQVLGPSRTGAKGATRKHRRS